jgi:hypothetical protein
MAGTYFALVSNDFGSNIAETKVIQNCKFDLKRLL